MQKVAVVTDSCASIPEKLLAGLNIHTVAYYIHRGQEVLRDLVTIQRDEFIRWLMTATVLPTTASPGPGDYLSTYERLIEEEGAEEIISIHMTSKGSGAYQAAMAARPMLLEKFPKVRIDIIDTLNVSMCQGWMVIEAARMALAGLRLSAISEQVRNMIPIARMLQTADTLKYLYMGGRIGKAQRLLGTLLNVKPVVGMEDGVIVPLGVARSQKRAWQMMVDIVEAAVGKMGRIRISFVHAGAHEEIQKLKAMAEERLNCVESLIAELSPALMVHSGPGTTGLCYYPVSE
jgi:DegV family protein with EDD domain